LVDGTNLQSVSESVPVLISWIKAYRYQSVSKRINFNSWMGSKSL